jgi:hypothetical protein
MTAHIIRYTMSHFVVYLQVLFLAAPIVLSSMPFVSAAELTTRSISISTAQIGAAAQHSFTFTVPSTAVIGSISFEYCTNSPLEYVPCVAPAGLDYSSAALTSQTGNTGFSISVPDSTASKVVLTRGPAAGAVGVSTYAFNNIINPTTSNETSFVRIATYGSTDGTGAINDQGAVAMSTSEAFEVTAYVPPFLTFCIGVFVTLNCNSVTGDRIDVGELQDNLTTTASMQFSGATNDVTGFTTYITGNTMTSGNNIIDALAANGPSVTGTSQFGLNVRANTAPTAGLDPIGPGSTTATAGYNTPNSYRFVNGEAITISPIPTDFKIFTATYIVNVAPSQPAGIYATTMTYTAVASF